MQREIETYDTLWNLVDLDANEHLIKEQATLFLAAMQDWPTPNQDSILKFISDLKSCFGEPLTFNKIKPESFNGLNAWQMETAASLFQMVELSGTSAESTQLDEIINDILVHYNKEFSRVDFYAELHYLPTQEGGRETPAASGYRPQLKFDFTQKRSSGQQTFIDVELAHPGDVLSAKIKVLSPHYFYGKLCRGMKFEFGEGATLVGTGEVKYIVNDKLEKEEISSPYNPEDFSPRNFKTNRDQNYHFRTDFQ